MMKYPSKLRQIILFALLTSGLSWLVVSFFPNQFTFNWWIVLVINLLNIGYVISRK
jgi:apolipoprotein N-acyltransferase